MTRDTDERQPMDTIDDVISVIEIVFAGYRHGTGESQQDGQQITTIISDIAHDLPSGTTWPDKNTSNTRSIST